MSIPQHDERAGLTPRQHWMQVLARAGSALEAYSTELCAREYRMVRRPETGMVMVRGRAGGDGAPFNLGEMTVTRCVVQLGDGTAGHSYIAGRAPRQAELAALADALLQGVESSHWMRTVIAPLEASQHASRQDRLAQTAQTRVEFSTLVRGED